MKGIQNTKRKLNTQMQCWPSVSWPTCPYCDPQMLLSRSLIYWGGIVSFGSITLLWSFSQNQSFLWASIIAIISSWSIISFSPPFRLVKFVNRIWWFLSIYHQCLIRDGNIFLPLVQVLLSQENARRGRKQNQAEYRSFDLFWMFRREKHI